MNPFKSWSALLYALVGLGLALLAAGRGAAQSSAQVDPVEELRQALALPGGAERNKEVLAHRIETLKKLSAAVKTVGDLRRALALTEWKDTSAAGKIQTIDQEARDALGKRLIDDLNAAAKGAPVCRAAVANFAGDIGVELRGLKDSTAGFARNLTATLVKLTRDSDPTVRVAAVSALGKINPVPAEAVPALAAVLAGDNPPLRRAAEDSLLNLVRTVALLKKKGRTQTDVVATTADVMDAAAAVVPAAALGLRDPDVQVRRLGQEALLLSAFAINDLIRTPFKPNEMPPEGRNWTEEELREYNIDVKGVQENEKYFQPLTEAFRKEGAALAKSLSDPDARVRILARQTLEIVSSARLRLKKLNASIPNRPNAPKLQAQLDSLQNDRLGEAVRPGIQVIAGRIDDPDVRVRRAAIDFLEMLEDAAAPAVPQLAKALRDRDRFVRWSAARALGRVGPVQVGLTAPLLAEMVCDRDIDVSQAASYTLERYGLAARVAVPILVKQLQKLAGTSDAGVELGIIYALVSIGGQDAEKIVMPMASLLSRPDARVRKAAAEALGFFGAAAMPAAPALRDHLFDEDADVRRAVSDALLSIGCP